MSKLVIIKVPSKVDVQKVINLLPESLNDKYQILVLAPGRDVEPFDEFQKRLEENAKTVLSKLKKSVNSYVG